MSAEHDVIVVGAGMAGLACARALIAAGREPLVLERSHTIGGRVRTDAVDGFLLDHGFQVLPTAYREARAVLDLDRLDLGLFERGAIIRSEGRFRRLADPRHAPVRSLRALAGGLVGVRDGAAVLKLLRGSGDETTTADALRRAGVSRSNGRDLLRAVPARDLPRGAADDVEPLSRLRPARVLRRAGGAAGRRHGGDCDATRGGA